MRGGRKPQGGGRHSEVNCHALSTVALDKFKSGDNLQFEDAAFQDDTGIKSLGQPDYTAVVYGVQDNQLYILHQNVDGDRTVSTMQLNLADKTSGDVIAYRPAPEDSSTPVTTTP